MKKFIERLLIKWLKYLNADLLAHAHIQIGAGHNTYLSGEDYIIEHAITNILKRDPLIIFDVGTNIGEYANMLRSKFSTAQIYCFEPLLETYNELTVNAKGPNFHHYNLAIGKEKGKIAIYKSSNNHDGSMATVYKDAISNIFTFAGEPNEKTEYDLISIDEFCNTNFPDIDFLKIDVEGHELDVLKGAEKMIAQNKINIIQFEFNEFNIFSKSFMWDFYNILKNYDFYRITPQNKLYPMGSYYSSLEIFRYQNILAINKSLKYIS